MKDLQASVIIVGEIPCCVCGEMMSQKDVKKQEAILSTSKGRLPFCNIIAHLNHFYVKENGRFAPTADYELSMAKFAMAAGKDAGHLTPEAERRVLDRIAELEIKL